MLGGSGVEPTQRRIIVVRSRINDLAGSAMWQIHVRAHIAKAELQHGHSWNLQPLTQRVHFRRDVATVSYTHLTQWLLDHLRCQRWNHRESRCPRALPPLSLIHI